jgi:catalase-peroxidase
MGLIYVNPEGPVAIPILLPPRKDIRETFARMAMDDEETVALTCGGHTFGKTHGAGPATHVGAEPEARRARSPWVWVGKQFGSGKGGHRSPAAWKSWTTTPAKWSI